MSEALELRKSDNTVFRIAVFEKSVESIDGETRLSYAQATASRRNGFPISKGAFKSMLRDLFPTLRFHLVPYEARPEAMTAIVFLER